LSNWTSGYVSDIDYTYGYYRELNPFYAKHTFLSQGIVFPEVKYACELGFGQGISTVIHGSASDVEWYGTDFNPSQAAFASNLAKTAGSKCHLYDDSFGDFAARPELPNFDFIGLHGVWSWVSAENQQAIVDFIRRKLNVGGVLYISYNTLPGWSSFAPMRHLMTLHADIIGSEGEGLVKRIDGALNFAGELLQTEPVFSEANPKVKERLEKLHGMSRHYLAHEYFNKDWSPIHFKTMAEALEPAKVSFACSAALGEHIDIINFNQEQKKLLDKITDPTLRQSVRDFMVNQQFRRDYWVKGLQRMSKDEQVVKFRSENVMLTTHRSAIELKISGSRTQGSELKKEIYDPLLDILESETIISIAELESKLSKHKIELDGIFQAVNILAAKDNLAFTQEAPLNEEIIKRAQALNKQIMERGKFGTEVNALACPLTGGALPLTRVHQLFILAIENGNKSPQEWAKFAWSKLQSAGQKLLKGGRTLDSDEENLGYLLEMATGFEREGLPLARTGKVI